MKLLNKLTDKRIKLDNVKNEKGIGLVEVILALGISIVVITSLVSLSVYTLRNSLQSKLLLRGSKLANEELERARAYRDNSPTWEQFVGGLLAANCTTACYINVSLAPVSGEEQTNPNYATRPTENLWRSFTISDPVNLDVVSTTDNVIRISVATRWEIGGVTKRTNVYTDLSNWR
ncbi:hypothetical protein A2W32_01320 [candidate division WWE3 bacterium RBG_16_37_10]|uniref:Uncharacterized protein n=1 Tax=candidate division WWE3 bacterium RBG_16_37_10 TaxID=1802610 RepID=A0A1F4UYY8_UNCKA|nr:MAG: hypothetical protein A2W32_01320 [candidate division WWE3 bacterium RBG_16_37_10]